MLASSSLRFLTLPASDARSRDALWRGTVRVDGVLFKAIPFSTHSASGASSDEYQFMEEIVFELRAPEELQSVPSFFTKWMITFRVYSLSATASPCLATLLYGSAAGWTVHGMRALLAWVGAVFLQMAINVLNDVEDHMRLIDLPGQQGGSGAIQKGWIAAYKLNYVGKACILAAILCGLPSILVQPQLLIIPILIAGVGVIGYSGKPFNIKYRALGDAAVLLLCGPVLTMAYAIASFDTYDLSVLLIGFSLGFAAISILHANNLQDIDIDRKRSARTLATVLSFSKARRLIAVFYIIAYVFIFYFSYTSGLWAPATVALFAVPLFWKLSRRAIRSSGPHSPLLHLLRVDTAKAHLIFGVLVCIGMALKGRF